MKRIRVIPILAIIGLAAFLMAGPAQADYVDNGNGTVTDLSTGLIWEKAGSAGAMIWEQALAWCQQATTAGYSDWRLPNKRELEHLADKSRYDPAIDPAFTEPGNKYWCGTTYARYSNDACYVNIGSGYSGFYGKNGTNHVRCVRGWPQS